MPEENEKLPSDAEDGGLKPIDPKDQPPPPPPKDGDDEEKAPSRQPS